MRVTPDCDSINSILISAAPGIQANPEVAFDGTNYMTVWQDHAITGTARIFGARVSQAGTVLDPAGIQIGPTDGTFQNQPSIAFLGDKYFAAWGFLSAPFGISGRFINLDGTLGDTVRVAPVGAEVHNTCIAYDGEKMLVIWAQYPDTIFGQFVSTTGSLIGSSFVIAGNIVIGMSGSLCFSGSEYFTTYSLRIGANFELWGRRYDVSGNPVGSEFRIANPAHPAAEGFAAPGPEDYLCVWSSLLYPSDIYGNLDVEVGIEDAGSRPVTAEKPLPATIVSGPLILPDGEDYKVLDISGRVVPADKVQPGIYFIARDGVVVQKVVKIK